MAAWDDIGSFLSSVLGHSAKTIEAATPSAPAPAPQAGPSFWELAGENIMQRPGALSPFIGAAMAGPGIRREATARQAAIPKTAAAISSASSGRISPEQARSFLEANPNAGPSILSELLKPTAAVRPIYDKRGFLIDPTTGAARPVANLPPAARATEAKTLQAQDLADSWMQFPNPGDWMKRRDYLVQQQRQRAVDKLKAEMPEMLQLYGAKAQTGADIKSNEPMTPAQKAEASARSVTTAKDTLALAAQVYDMQTPTIKRAIAGLNGDRAKAIASMRPVRGANGEILGFTTDGKTMYPVP